MNEKMMQGLKYYYILLTFFLIFLVLVSVSSAELPDSSRLMKMAMTHYEANDHAGALKYADLACQADTNLPSAWTVKAAYLLDMGKYEEALHSCDIAISRDPNFAPAWATRGLILFSTGNEKQGEESWNKSIELDSSFAESLVMENIARQEKNLGEFKGADTVSVAYVGIIIRKLGLPAIKKALISMSNFASKHKGEIALAVVSLIPWNSSTQDQIANSSMVNSSSNGTNLSKAKQYNQKDPLQIFRILI